MNLRIKVMLAFMFSPMNALYDLNSVFKGLIIVN